MTLGMMLRACAALAVGMLPWCAGATAAQTLDIELNKLEDRNGQCIASVLLTNRLPETLEAVRFDLYILDANSVIVRRLILDTGPMRTDKTTVASFALLAAACSNIGRLLINNVPICKTTAGVDVDCVAALNLSSRTTAPLVK